MKMDFTGKTVVVTGGSGGIGKAICMEFAAHNANVAVCDIGDMSKADAIAAEIRAKGLKSIAVNVDVTNEAQVNAMVAAVVNEFGSLDIICNNAGVITSMKTVDEITLDEWEKMFAVNARGVFLCCKAVVPQMKKQGYGRIINTASQAGKKGIPLLGHYCATKAAVIMLTKTMALELAETGIHVNAVCPGSVDTEMTDMEAETVSKKTGRPAAVIKQEWTDSVPMKKLATPQEIAAMFVVLASEYADYMTGQAVNVSGGQEMN